MSENGKSSNGDADVSLDLEHLRDPNDNASDRSDGVVAKPGGGFNTLLAATFVVFLGYGTVLPILPLFLDRVLSMTGADEVALHTGLLTGVYTLALFAFAPLWGGISDRLGRRPVLLWGLAGFALAMLGFSLVNDLPLAYGMRALAGALAAAVIPVALAQAAEYGGAVPRARRFAWLSAASTLGFLSGPMLSGWLASIPMVMPQSDMLLGGPVAWPFVVTAGLAGAVWLMAYRHVPERPARLPSSGRHTPEVTPTWPTGGLLTLTLLAMLGLGAFEVGLSLQARQSIGLDPFRIGLLFTACSLVMLMARRSMRRVRATTASSGSPSRRAHGMPPSWHRPPTISPFRPPMGGCWSPAAPNPTCGSSPRTPSRCCRPWSWGASVTRYLSGHRLPGEPMSW